MNEEFITLISVLGGLVLLLCPLAYAIYILGRLDIAAKKRKLSGVENKFSFMIVDFFSLILLVQLPFNFVSLRHGDGVSIFIIGISLFAVLLVWYTTIRTVSQAGISSFGWRALVSMIVIPTMYVGSFYFGVGSINMLWGDASAEAVAWLAVISVGMFLSFWIVKGALKATEAAVDQVSIQAQTATSDPFAD